MTMYFIFKFFHVFAAIVALGTGTTLAMWKRSAKTPENEKFVMETSLAISQRYIYPGMIIMFITGFGMTGVGKLDMTQFWILYSIIVLTVTIILGYTMIMPGTKKLISLFDSNRESNEYKAIAKRNKILTSALLGLAHIAIILMVFRFNF